jgi:hypothetical protein
MANLRHVARARSARAMPCLPKRRSGAEQRTLALHSVGAAWPWRVGGLGRITASASHPPRDAAPSFERGEGDNPAAFTFHRRAAFKDSDVCPSRANAPLRREVFEDARQLGEVGLCLQTQDEVQYGAIRLLVHDTGDNTSVFGDHLVPRLVVFLGDITMITAAARALPDVVESWLTCSLWPRPKAAFGPGFCIGGRKHISRAAASRRVRVAMAADFELADLVAVNFVGSVG